MWKPQLHGNLRACTGIDLPFLNNNTGVILTGMKVLFEMSHTKVYWLNGYLTHMIEQYNFLSSTNYIATYI